MLDKLGFPSNSCRYCSLGLACTLDNDPATAPWGGLPWAIAVQTASAWLTVLQRIVAVRRQLAAR